MSKMNITNFSNHKYLDFLLNPMVPIYGFESKKLKGQLSYTNKICIALQWSEGKIFLANNRYLDFDKICWTIYQVELQICIIVHNIVHLVNNATTWVMNEIFSSRQFLSISTYIQFCDNI